MPAHKAPSQDLVGNLHLTRPKAVRDGYTVYTRRRYSTPHHVERQIELPMDKSKSHGVRPRERCPIQPLAPLFPRLCIILVP